MIKNGRVTLKELCKLRRAYFKISTMEAYLDWKDSILLLFCSVHDLDTLARIKCLGIVDYLDKCSTK